MTAEKLDAKGTPSPNLKQALLILSGAVSIGYVSAASAQTAANPQVVAGTPNVTVEKVAKPKNTIVKTPQTWQRVVIDLTPDQMAQLAKQGVKTDKLNITTYNIERLSGAVYN